jgi:hypothetical protein
MFPVAKAQFSGRATVVAASRKRDMTRAETAQYITDHWFPHSPKTLAKLAVTGGGPPFRKAGRVPLYSEPLVDEWAESKISPLVRSTTELVVNVGTAEKVDEAPNKEAREPRSHRKQAPPRGVRNP